MGLDRNKIYSGSMLANVNKLCMEDMVHDSLNRKYKSRCKVINDLHKYRK